FLPSPGKGPFPGVCPGQSVLSPSGRKEGSHALSPTDLATFLPPTHRPTTRAPPMIHQPPVPSSSPPYEPVGSAFRPTVDGKAALHFSIRSSMRDWPKSPTLSLPCLTQELKFFTRSLSASVRAFVSSTSVCCRWSATCSAFSSSCARPRSEERRV